MAPTILIALAGLDIGGTETHAVALCKHLKDLNYNIIVASSGGIYENEMVDYGIKHYNVVLNTKKPIEVIKSFFKLARIVKDEKIDLIHAHARIPAFICNIVSKVLKVNFITTSHAKFRSNFILKYLSAWGQKTIAVSDDIKEHLIHTFHVKEENISVITNGIDTNQFSLDIEHHDLYSQLGIDPSYKKIVWISRIDDDLGDTVINVINSIDKVLEKFNNAVIVIVGSGNRLDEIKAKAEDKNVQLGKNAIIVLGRRTDINKILNFCDVFIGISRAALEAMSCQKPVIIAGPWSFVGILDKDNISKMRQDNFTGRSCSLPVTTDLLSDAIINLLSMSESEKTDLGKLGRKVVLEEYSINSMIQKTIVVYEEVLNNVKRSE